MMTHDARARQNRKETEKRDNYRRRLDGYKRILRKKNTSMVYRERVVDALTNVSSFVFSLSFSPFNFEFRISNCKQYRPVEAIPEQRYIAGEDFKVECQGRDREDKHEVIFAPINFESHLNAIRAAD